MSKFDFDYKDESRIDPKVARDLAKKIFMKKQETIRIQA